MRWRNVLWHISVIVLPIYLEFGRIFSKRGVAVAAHWTVHKKLEARERTRELWRHGFDHYMAYAFPMDELRPLSCSGRGPDWNNPHNFANNDVAGNFSVTLIDILDTFVVLNDKSGFEEAVKNVIDWVSFDSNTKPQVFETTIRVLGGLLSGHLFASNPSHPFHLSWYRGELLHLAHDLGQRLLPAFLTPTGIPFARINLKHGIHMTESVETCTAGAGSLILEFATLSRLTGDERFEKAAYKAFFALWNRKSDIGLVGNTINIFTGKWLSPEVSGIGAGIDSFFEYALKWYILSGEMEFLDVWHEAYAAIMQYSRGADGFWFRAVNIHTGDLAFTTTDSLSAFWSGLQVLAGDVENAIKSHLIYWNIWKRNSGLPEVWDISFMQATSRQYPLRPEFIESTYYLYRATKDSFYLDVGERVLYDLIYRAKVDCGLSSIMDLNSNKLDDRMESFVLSETLKYLFLLFDEENPLNKDDSNFVFTTEGHILTLDPAYLKPISPVRRKLRRVENLQCPIYQPTMLGSNLYGLLGSIPSRDDYDFARALVGTAQTSFDEQWWSPDGKCIIPTVIPYSFEFIMSVNGANVPEDFNPNSAKLQEVVDGYVLHNITGIRAHIVRRLDGKGYDIVKLGPYTIRRGQTVYINDTNLGFKSVSAYATQGENEWSQQPREVSLRFSSNLNTLASQEILIHQSLSTTDTIITAYTSLFGRAPLDYAHYDQNLNSFGHGTGTSILYVKSNSRGCDSYSPGIVPEGSAVIVERGDCTFLQKLVQAVDAGASGVIVIIDDDLPLNPSADAAEIEALGDLLDMAVLVAVTRSSGEMIFRMLDVLKTMDTPGQILLFVEREPQTIAFPGQEQSADDLDVSVQDSAENQKHVLYINGNPLQNTRLFI